MSITSMYFLFVFLVVAIAVYYIACDSIKEYVLLVISLVFYSLGSLHYIVLLIINIMITISIGRQISVTESQIIRKLLLTIGIIFNVGILFYYKYFDFALETWGQLSKTEISVKNLLLPMGISFYTFKAISYMADVYLGRVKLSQEIVRDALYLSLFPQIQSGPITRYDEFVRENEEKKELFCTGIVRFMIGFCKKVIIANMLSNITKEVFAAPIENCSTLYAWLGALSFSLQLFYDFSGYSDMAIGLSGMFGYHCRENFNYPYMTESVAQFWRRWHISLGEWFRDYIYIPLGGSRNKKKWKVYVNLLVVWCLTGIWHGASWSFVLWGLGYFVAIAFERATDISKRLATHLSKLLYRIIVLLFINFQWVLFNSTSIIDGLRFIKCMIVYKGNELADLRARFLLSDYFFFVLIAIVLCFPIVPFIEKKVSDNLMLSKAFEITKNGIILVAFIWAISFVVAGQNNPFVYANF